jgi:hypothetical protein
MQVKLDLLGAFVAQVVFISSIATFLSRMVLGTRPGHWIGVPILLMAFPLAYLLVRAPEFDRPLLYYVQISVMLAFLLVLLLVDYVFRLDFRQTRWMVISFVVLYFAGMGGMIGIASLAGRTWTTLSVILFLVAGILAFVQRGVTGF